MIYKIAESSIEKERVYHLIFNKYIEWGYFHPTDFPEEKITDEFDKRSETWIFIAISEYDDEVVGTLRLVRDYPDYPPLSLPMGKNFDLNQLPVRGKQLGEICRFAAEGSGLTALYLIKSVMLFAEKIGITHFVIACPLLHKKHYASFNFKQIGKEYLYKGVRDHNVFISMLVSLKEAIENMHQTNSFFDRIFKKQTDNIILPEPHAIPNLYDKFTKLDTAFNSHQLKE